ncbi:MAG: hypothetical protein EBY16_03860 [Gammaproteobacteria bacterium]|nr:hypothetical protein [Gammaproteobacteria bacterium]
MNSIEERIVSKIAEGKDISLWDVKLLYSLPLGSLTKAFYNKDSIKIYYQKKDDNAAIMLGFRLALEEYIVTRDPAILSVIETAMLAFPTPILSLSDKERDSALQNKAAGTYLMPFEPDLIRRIYQLEDSKLTALFQQYFPVPRAQLFDTVTMPKVIQAREAEISKTMSNCMLHLKAWEQFSIIAQRQFRKKKRYQEEINRITLGSLAEIQKRSKKVNRQIEYEFSELGFSYEKMSAEDLMRDANTPYKPKCGPELAARIMAAAEKVSAFSSVKHITSASALQMILDDALYGRRTLMDFYIPFNPAALSSFDVKNGDGNVVCLGPQGIDPLAKGDIVIEFDLSKLFQQQPPAFFKQLDLGYQLDEIREVHLGKTLLRFDHTSAKGPSFPRDPNKVYLTIIDKGYSQIAAIPNASLISYNLEQMHQILALNFFRFIDRMQDTDQDIDMEYIKSFYAQVNQLTDEELILFLTELEEKMTDTAEFNFYGAYQIDFATILSISAKSKEYTLHLPRFIEELKTDQDPGGVLSRAQQQIPELFRSYRFLDYLLAQVAHSNAQYDLDTLRKKCETPKWVEYVALPESERLCYEAFKVEREELDSLIKGIKAYGNSADKDDPFEQALTNFSAIASDFFSAKFEDKTSLKNTLQILKSGFKDLSQVVPAKFKDDGTLWPSIERRFVGIDTTLRAILDTGGIGMPSLFKSESSVSSPEDTELSQSKKTGP